MAVSEIASVISLLDLLHANISSLILQGVGLDFFVSLPSALRVLSFTMSGSLLLSRGHRLLESFLIVGGSLTLFPFDSQGFSAFFRIFRFGLFVVSAGNLNLLKS